MGTIQQESVCVLCAFVHACVCMCVSVRESTYVETRDRCQVSSGVILYLTFPTASLSKAEVHHWPDWLDSELRGLNCFLSSGLWIFTCTLAFTWVLGSRTHILVLAQQGFTH